MTKHKTGSQPPDADAEIAKAPSVTRLIREAVIKDEKATVEEIGTQLGDVGKNTTKGTINTVRFHTVATLSVLRDLGLLKNPPRGHRPEPTAAAPETAEAT